MNYMPPQSDMPNDPNEPTTQVLINLEHPGRNALNVLLNATKRLQINFRTEYFKVEAYYPQQEFGATITVASNVDLQNLELQLNRREIKLNNVRVVARRGFWS